MKKICLTVLATFLFPQVSFSNFIGDDANAIIHDGDLIAVELQDWWEILVKYEGRVYSCRMVLPINNGGKGAAVCVPIE